MKIAMINVIKKLKNYTSYRSVDLLEEAVACFLESADNPLKLVESIIFSCIAIEKIIREKLQIINPALILSEIDPFAIAKLSKKENQLIKKPLKKIKIKSANILTLFNRFFLFCEGVKYRNGLERLFEIRNEIVHSSNEYVNESLINIILTKYAFPFMKMYSGIFDKKLWEEINRMAKIAHDMFQVDLNKKITAAKKKFDLLSEHTLKQKLESKLILGLDESEERLNLICPACRKLTTSLVAGIDIDYNPDGPPTTNVYSYTICRACNLELDSIEYKEIINHPEKYLGKGKSWSVIEDLESPDPEYDDYYGID